MALKHLISALAMALAGCADENSCPPIACRNTTKVIVGSRSDGQIEGTEIVVRFTRGAGGALERRCALKLPFDCSATGDIGDYLLVTTPDTAVPIRTIEVLWSSDTSSGALTFEAGPTRGKFDLALPSGGSTAGGCARCVQENRQLRLE